MKKLAIFFAVSIFFISCNVSTDYFSKDEDLGFAVGRDKYVILIKSDNSYDNVHREALKRATKLAKLNGYRYFKVLNGAEVDILQDGRLIEKHFANENLDQGYFEEDDLEPAYKLTVRCYRKRPFFGQVIDVCRYSRWLHFHH